MSAQDHIKNKAISMQAAQENTGLDFNLYYEWFNEHFSKLFAENSAKFLNINLNFHLLAVTDKPSLIWKGNDYFVTQIELEDSCSVYVRISDDIFNTIMDKALGAKYGDKKAVALKGISELEAHIITSYNEFLFKRLDGNFINNKSIVGIAENFMFFDEDLIHLTFYVSDFDNPEDEYGKIIFSFPEYILKNLVPVNAEHDAFDVERLYDCYSRVNVIVGKAKSTLEEVRSLEAEDIVILDKSNTSMMILDGEEKLKFQVAPDPSMILDLHNSDGGNIMSEPNAPVKNIWDALQLEITAEFQKIKMSLGDLKQVTEGLVVDVAPIVNNEIFLHVEGRIIAVGELVIVGDKYGVKINKIIHEETDRDEQVLTRDPLMESKPRAIESEKKSEKQQSVEEESNYDTKDDDDFDYSDFEIEDEDDI